MISRRSSTSKSGRHQFLAVLLVLSMIVTVVPMMAPSVSADGEGWLEGWDYRKSVEIEAAAGAGTNYQVLFHLYYGAGTDSTTTYQGIPVSNIYLNGHAQADFDDVRFTSSDGISVLPTYRESFTASTDVLFWTKITADINSTEATIYLYYGNADAVSASNGELTFQYFQDYSEGTAWVRQGLAIPSTSSWQYIEPVVIYESNPQVLISESQVLKMWFHGVGQEIYSGQDRLFYAESVDGKIWTFANSGDPILGDNIWCPFVFKYGDLYHLYVWKSGQTFAYYQSSNGVSWTLISNNVLTLGSSGAWDDFELGNMYLWVEGSTWYMIYEAATTDYNWHLGLATSSDGQSWTKYGSAPVLGTSGSYLTQSGPEVHKIGSTYYMWYHGGASGSLPTDIYIASSTDLHTWTHSDKTVFYRTQSYEGVGNSFGQIADPSIIEFEGQTWMYYDALTDQSTRNGIALAMSAYPIGTLATSLQNHLATTTELFDGTGNGVATISGGSLSLTGTGTLPAARHTSQNFGPDISVRQSMNLPSTGSTTGANFGLETSSVSDINQVMHYYSHNENRIRAKSSGTATNVDNCGMTSGTHIFEDSWTSGRVNYRMDGADLTNSPITTNVPSVAIKLMWMADQSSTLTVQWTEIRKYVYPEPTHGAIGEEEASASSEPWPPTFDSGTADVIWSLASMAVATLLLLIAIGTFVLSAQKRKHGEITDRQFMVNMVSGMIIIVIGLALSSVVNAYT